MAQITKDTTIGEALQIDRSLAPILMQFGMHCVGCPSSYGETIEQASMVHGMDVDALLEALNDHLNK